MDLRYHPNGVLVNGTINSLWKCSAIVMKPINVVTTVKLNGVTITNAQMYKTA